MSVRITSRPASPDEIALLGRALLPPWAYALRVAAGTYLLWWFIGFGLLMTVGTAASVFSVAAAPSTEASTFQWRPWMEVLLVLVLWGPVFLLPLLVAVRRGRAARVRRRNLWIDRRERRIEVVAIEDEPCTVIDAGKAGRYHLFSIDAGHALCLSEHNHALQMAFERLVDEQEEEGLPEDGIGDEVLERLPLFPSTRFELHRWPHEGTVVALDSSGAALEPEAVVDLSILAPAPRRHLFDALMMESARLPLGRDAFRPASARTAFPPPTR